MFKEERREKDQRPSDKQMKRKKIVWDHQSRRYRLKNKNKTKAQRMILSMLMLLKVQTVAKISGKIQTNKAVIQLKAINKNQSNNYLNNPKLHRGLPKYIQESFTLKIEEFKH